MKEKYLTQIIGNSESLKAEWKPSLSQINEIVEAISAFSNAEGGKVFIGISKPGKLLGLQRITTKTIEGKQIIVIDVRESGDRLTLAFGRPYIRVGKSTMKMSAEI